MDEHICLVYVNASIYLPPPIDCTHDPEQRCRLANRQEDDLYRTIVLREESSFSGRKNRHMPFQAP